ncbi:RNA polymerase sigma-70 factor (ECF subfamily) [Pedobacter sp. AK017]|uniref:sigma-70 family RNA polymerase sigma factor n=1 Tax=Pedobacter sp. AK017 TaxID=2723073 RepID=UPI001609D092|nr:sigma-70 family RNA polymerase sigma factor [Pedobacter sp. AK017]MBB5440232.1 RNA polymerase sigma-70 factor (ECF subfamily) [Pedobacter sp. AK017]
MTRSTYADLSDRQLLDLLQEGNERALSEIYERYWSKLYLQAYNVIRDRQVSEDIVQEIIVQLWVKRSVNQIDCLKAYLYTCVKYQVFKALPLVKHKPVIYPDHFSFVNDTDSPLITKDIQRLLDEAIANLPLKCRNVFNLSRKDHLSTKEVAMRLGITPKTVENQLTIALRRIRFALDKVLLLALVIGSIRL